MSKLNTKGNMRGKGFAPRWAECRLCGEPFWKDTARRVYCDACREIRKEERAEASRIRMKELYQMKKAGLLPDSKLPKVEEPEGGFVPHVCMVTKLCKYGENTKGGCIYETIEHKLRTQQPGHQIVRGRCSLFRPREGKKDAGWKRAKDKKLEGMK